MTRPILFPDPTALALVEQILQLFHQRGDSAYLGEEVSQTEHALQSAWAAEKAGADSFLIAAALLHDIGHLLHHLPENCADQGIDDRHEELGYRWLEKHFPPQVSEPVRLHVAAKRYLCATQQDYRNRLSPASLQSLLLQGGPMSPEEVNAFSRLEHGQSAVSLRHWDDEAKIKNLNTPDLEYFRKHLENALVRRAN